MISHLRKYKYTFTFATVIALAILCSCLSHGGTVAKSPNLSTNIDNLPRFGLPIDCKLGQDCYIMHYVDRDPTPDAIDFGCGRQTYDGHNGTDFGIADERAMAKGVAVKAVAAGKVLRIRDGIADRRVKDQTTKNQVKGIECGNGIVIAHGNGWETQYCHLRKGSIIVKPNMQVEKGTVLGMVGSSGLASFPHVHLSVRYQGKVVDPFVGPNTTEGCQVERHPLWEEPLDYVPTGLVRAGFATQPPKLDDLWEGRFSETVLTSDSPMLTFWVQPYGVLKDDVQVMRMFAPDGTVVAENESRIQSSNRVWMSFIGKRNTQQRPLVPGVWRGEYQLKRGGNLLLDVKRECKLLMPESQ
ncbi:MAG: M23 family metallopeptidase [Oscillatoriaceae bacterium SKYG93]|nr:M23 family metallopeptidase [Oscillatoriaceae bacterium SKYG93]MDW8455144.1 M23 family metallopeptidase [Oscillatoriaceae cyanobacterium SKYGB_i_bin93]